MLYWFIPVLVVVYLLNFIEITNYESMYYILTTYTYNYVFESEMRPSLSFLIGHEFCQVSLHSKDSKYVQYLYLYKSEHVYQNYNILISVQRINKSVYSMIFPLISDPFIHDC